MSESFVVTVMALRLTSSSSPSSIVLQYMWVFGASAVLARVRGHNC